MEPWVAVVERWLPWLGALLNMVGWILLIISVLSFGLMFLGRGMQGKGEPLSVKEVEKVLNEEGPKTSRLRELRSS